MAIRPKRAGDSKVAIDMTPMIDIVFQLLAFFIFTLKITAQEGDFNIKMPLAAPRAGTPDPNQLPPMKIRLKATADGTGSCADIVLNDRSFGSDGWDALRNHIAGIVGDGSLAASAEVELDCDYNLDYENVIKCITAVSGRRTADGHIVKLVEKIKFSPPRGPGG